jgi:hypothetical protein
MTGRILVVLVFLLSIGSLIIYFIDTYKDSFQVETCVPWFIFYFKLNFFLKE